MPPLRDLTGQRFGRLTVLRRGRNSRATPGCPGPKVRWICLCDCGKRRLIQATHLCSGRTRSCGCIRRKDSPGPR